MSVANVLIEKGIPVTAQRLAVFQAVLESPHQTADEIARLVRQEIGAISKQAVYDSLRLFVREKVVRSIEPAGSPVLYESRTGDNHHHLICRLCRKTVDVNCSKGEAPCLSVEQDYGYVIDEAEVIYWGLCPKCQSSDSECPEHKTKR